MSTKFVLAALFMIAAGSIALAGEVPQLINYQGRLVDASGEPLETANRDLVIHIYDVATGGTPIWGPQSMPETPVVNGYYNVLIGPSDESDPMRSITDAFGDKDRYLEVSVDGTVIAPRQRIVSAPFAIQAENANHALEADHAAEADHALVADVATNALSILGEVPIGGLVPYFGDPADLPSHWIICDGSTVADPDSPLDGQTIPDLRQRFVRGADADNGYSVGATGGRDDIPSHSHYFSDSDSFVYFPRASGNGFVNAYNPATSAGAFDTSLRNLTAPSGGGSAYDTHGHVNGNSFISGFTDSAGFGVNMPSFFSLNYIIRIR